MSWSDASLGDQQLYFILSYLYEKHEKILFLLLNPDCPRLIHPQLSFDDRSKGLSTGEKLLMKIGLDVWDGTGGIHYNELYQDLDSDSFQKVLTTLLYLRSPGRAILF